MTGLTPDQIAFGSKAKMQTLGKAPSTLQRLDLGACGPCVRCHLDTIRYGPHGTPLCRTCQPRAKERPTTDG
jgi:hypothetical protein